MNDIAIFCDSQAARRALSFHVICSKMVWEYLVKRHKLGKNNKVGLVWIPDHSGIEGEKGNELAKEGTLTSFIRSELAWGKAPLESVNQIETLWLDPPGVSCTYLDLSENNLRILMGFLADFVRERRELLNT